MRKQFAKVQYQEEYGRRIISMGMRVEGEKLDRKQEFYILQHWRPCRATGKYEAGLDKGQRLW